MISKFALIFLGVLIVLNSTYGQHHYRKSIKNSTMVRNTTVANSVSTTDDYYDYYDYDVSYGFKRKFNKTFLYCFTMIIIFCL